jgi:hypothetical protein
MRTLPVTADILALLMAADAGLQRLKSTLAGSGFELKKTMGYPTKRGGVTVRAVWRKREDGVTVEFNGTFRYPGAAVGAARSAVAEARSGGGETGV